MCSNGNQTNRNERYVREGRLKIATAASRSGGIALGFVEAADISNQLFHHSDIIPAGRRFATYSGNIDLVCVHFFDRVHDAILIEGDNDDFLFNDLRIEDSALFRFLADVVPDVFIEGRLGRRGAERLQHVGPAANTRDDFGDPVIFEHIATRRLRRRTGGSHRPASREQSHQYQCLAHLHGGILNHFRPGSQSSWSAQTTEPDTKDGQGTARIPLRKRGGVYICRDMFAWFEKRKIRKAAAGTLFEAILKQSRQPYFYERTGVADSMDGRFDILCLHAAIVILRLRTDGREGAALGQALFDTMFRRMETDLREMGIGDLGVPKHMQKMMKAFNGRLHAYADALASRNPALFEITVARNVFRLQGEAIPPGAAPIADYAQRLYEAIAADTMDMFLDGRITLPAPEAATETVPRIRIREAAHG